MKISIKFSLLSIYLARYRYCIWELGETENREFLYSWERRSHFALTSSELGKFSFLCSVALRFECRGCMLFFLGQLEDSWVLLEVFQEFSTIFRISAVFFRKKTPWNKSQFFHASAISKTQSVFKNKLHGVETVDLRVWLILSVRR